MGGCGMLGGGASYSIGSTHGEGNAWAGETAHVKTRRSEVKSERMKHARQHTESASGGRKRRGCWRGEEKQRWVSCKNLFCKINSLNRIRDLPNNTMLWVPRMKVSPTCSCLGYCGFTIRYSSGSRTDESGSVNYASVPVPVRVQWLNCI